MEYYIVLLYWLNYPTKDIYRYPFIISQFSLTEQGWLLPKPEPEGLEIFEEA